MIIVFTVIYCCTVENTKIKLLVNIKQTITTNQNYKKKITVSFKLKLILWTSTTRT